MNNSMEKSIQTAWDFVFEKLFHPKTKLIYEYISVEGKDGAFVHLPTKEEIKRNYPNPCGWNTGMEDGTINGGVMMEAVLARYAVTKDENLKKYADDLCEGLLLNATVSKEKGFIARSRLPEDGVTHYINSSRDQYTHWVSAMLNFYHSVLCSAKQRKQIKQVLIEIAQKCERDIIPENLNCLLNEEGRPALVCEMTINDMVFWHESLRAPMFYMAAYVVSKDEHWLDAYRALRDWGLDYAEEIRLDRNFYESAAIVTQMQLSVRLLYNYETEENYKQRYKNLLEKVADWSELYLFESVADVETQPMPKTLKSWRDCTAEETHESTYNDYKVVTYDVSRMTWLRNGAESLIVQLLCPQKSIKQEQIDGFMKLISKVSFEDACNYFVVPFCCAWWMLREKGCIK